MMELKDRVLEKAHELFHRFGIRSVSMDELATQNGISKKTLYQLYTDKDELVDAVMSVIIEANRGECCTAQQEAENAVHEVFLAFDRVKEMFATVHPSVIYDLKKYHPATYQKFKEFQNGFLHKMIKENIEWGIKEGLYRAEVDIDVLTRYRIHTITLPFDPDVFPNNRTHLIHIEEQLFEHFLYGMSTTRGQKLIEKYKKQRIKTQA